MKPLRLDDKRLIRIEQHEIAGSTLRQPAALDAQDARRRRGHRRQHVQQRRSPVVVDAQRDGQQRFQSDGTERGFAVLALRGLEGGCSPEPEFATKWCWPSNERTAGRGRETVSEWKPALRAAAKSGAGGRRYVLGFSNGGFFAGLLAVRGWFEAEAFVVANAGPVEPVHALGAKPPLLLMSADEDSSQEGMMRLDDELTREGWLHENYSRAGTHELTDDEIDAALRFFVRLRDEKLPLTPPLSSHRPRAREAPPVEPLAAPNATEDGPAGVTTAAPVVEDR